MRKTIVLILILFHIFAILNLLAENYVAETYLIVANSALEGDVKLEEFK